MHARQNVLAHVHDIPACPVSSDDVQLPAVHNRLDIIAIPMVAGQLEPSLTMGDITLQAVWESCGQTLHFSPLRSMNPAQMPCAKPVQEGDRQIRSLLDMGAEVPGSPAESQLQRLTVMQDKVRSS